MRKEKSNKHKINFFDICVILLALVCIASIIGRGVIVGRENALNAPKEYVIGFQIDDIKSSSYDYFVAGDTVRIKSSNEVLGTLNNDLVRGAAIFTYTENKDGEETTKQLLYPSPISGRIYYEERCSIVGSIIVTGNMTDSGLFIDEGEYIVKNETLDIITERVEATVKIISIEEK